MENKLENYQPLVSVLIPIYNAEKYLKICFDSLLNQTYHNWEAICVNDGSKDGSVNIIKSYLNRDSRFKFISQENQGQPTAMNRALENAIGDYIMKLDADDYVSPNYIETAINRMDKENADGSVPNLCFVDMEGIVSPAKMDVDFYNDTISGKEGLRRAAIWKNIHANTIVKREIFDGVKYQTSYAFGEEVTGRKLIAKCEKIIYFPGVYYYRINPTSVTQKISAKRFDLCLSLLDTQKLLKEYNVYQDCKEGITMRLLNTLVSCQYYFFKYNNLFSKQEIKRAINSMSKLYEGIDCKELNRIYRHKGLLNYIFNRIKMSSYTTFRLISRLLYLKVKKAHGL